MFRKLILSAVIATGLTTTPTAAQAQPPAESRHARYVVLVWGRGQWSQYATFHDYLDASRTVWHLEGDGRSARIETVNVR
ncbi:MAG TPA: hypothetical protein VH092_19090 [Urbifossiella sp.]|nr:hypothetical protein [Urbifossiella sp.]